MVDAFARDFGIIGGFGQNKRALQHRLGMSGEALGGPFGGDFSRLHGEANILLQSRGVPEDTRRACVPNRRRGVMKLLHHRSHQTGIFKALAANDRAAKFEIGQDTLQWVLGLVIGRCGEKLAGARAPEVGRRDAQRLLALKIVEERALCDAGRIAEIVDRRRRKTLLADHVTGGFEEASFRVAGRGRRCVFLCHARSIPVGWYVGKSGFESRPDAYASFVGILKSVGSASEFESYFFKPSLISSCVTQQIIFDEEREPMSDKKVASTTDYEDVDDIIGLAAELRLADSGRLSSEEIAEVRSEEHTSELQSRPHLVCRLLL